LIHVDLDENKMNENKINISFGKTDK